MRALISHSYSRFFRVWRSTGFQVPHFQRSSYSSVRVDETLSLPVGNNGRVNLRITHPPKNGDTTARPQALGPNVILYLPPGPVFRESGAYAVPDAEPAFQAQPISNEISGSSFSPQNALALTTNSTVVTVEYRLGNTAAVSPRDTLPSSERPSASLPHEAAPTFDHYPTPIHDTITAFDWVQRNLQPAQLGVFGSHIGGSLALMLALTEAQSVKAVAAADPICDWPGLDEFCISEPEVSERPKRSSKKRQARLVAPLDLVPLLEARNDFFSSFERCFDAFASPVLFLRSAGRDVPKTFPQYLTGPDYPIPVLKKTRTMTTAERQAAAESSVWDGDTYPTDEGSSEEPELPARRRKALSRWPPYGLEYGASGNSWSQPEYGVRRLKMTLPWVRVFSGMDRALIVSSENSTESAIKSTVQDTTAAASTVLARQSEEMVSLLRRACFFGREKGYGERRVSLTRADDDLGQEVAGWFGDIFDGTLKDD